MAICDNLIDNGADFDCDLTGGVEPNLWLFNREEIASYQRSVANTQIIEDFVMEVIATVPKKGFAFRGYNNSVKPKTDGVQRPFGYEFNHTVDFMIFQRGSASKANIEKLAKSRAGVVAVVEYLGKTTDSTFEVYGAEKGLRVVTLSDDISNAENGGAYVLQLASPEDYKEPHMPATFFDTSYAVTKGNLLALIAPNT